MTASRSAGVGWGGWPPSVSPDAMRAMHGSTGERRGRHRRRLWDAYEHRRLPGGGEEGSGRSTWRSVVTPAFARVSAASCWLPAASSSTETQSSSWGAVTTMEPASWRVSSLVRQRLHVGVPPSLSVSCPGGPARPAAAAAASSSLRHPSYFPARLAGSCCWRLLAVGLPAAAQRGQGYCMAAARSSGGVARCRPPPSAARPPAGSCG